MFFDQRGGKSLVYDNTITWTTGEGAATRIREEHQDADGAGAAVDGVNGQPQHISDTYYWGNTANGAALVPSLVHELGAPCSICGEDVPTEDVNVWLEKASFDGTSGVGVGPGASRPVTCTVGVGYWATDERELARCTAPDTWAPFYTPLAYPHPLRGE